MSADNDAFSQFLHQGWQRVADRYEETWGSLTQPFIPHLLRAVHVKAGTRLLDLACGPGFAAEEAKSLGADPIGVDFSATMVQLARKRSPKIEFQVGDAQKLSFEDSRFDAIVMNFGVLHLSNPEAAFLEACRVLHPEGRYAFTVWAGPEESPGAKIVTDAIETYADQDNHLPEGPDSLLYSDCDRCREALMNAGFDPTSFSFETVSTEWHVATPAFIFESELEAGVRTGALLASQRPEALKEIRAHIEESVRTYAKEGAYAIPYTAHVIAVSAL
ncbi:methyltransferase domain-containing protein [bacterium]|nr:methyltransferase domain-containing protein [bacterium]